MDQFMMRLSADLVPILLLTILEALPFLLRLASLCCMSPTPIQTESAALQLGYLVRSLLDGLVPEGFTIREPERWSILAPKPLICVGADAGGTHFRR